GYGNLAVKRKLQMIVMSTVAAALALACVAILAYDQYTDAQDLRADLIVLAEMLGSNSTAALSFGDSKAAGEILEGLRAKPHIVSAVIYDQHGPFADYSRDGKPHAFPAPRKSESAWFEINSAKVFHFIQLNE